MKRVLMLGDSIRLGYAPIVRERLRGEYEVCYDEDNGRFAAYTLWQANQCFRNLGHFDVVHWNNGYWDMNVEAPMVESVHPLPDYLYYLKRILAEIRRNKAVPVFALTTPVISSGSALDTSGTGMEILYDNARVQAYNKAAAALMEQEQVAVNDFYTLCLRHPTYYKCPDNLHLTQEGYSVLADAAIAAIRAQTKD